MQESSPVAATDRPEADPASPGFLATLRRRRAGTSLPRLLFYEFIRGIAQVVLTLIYRIRAYGEARLPLSGAVLLVSNHQSYLDPPAIGAVVRRRQLDFLARGGLFHFKPLGFLIRSLNSIPLREDGSDAAAIKAVIRRLDEGGAVLIFPEGSRSPDGAMHPLKRGVAVLVKRARCPVVPVAVEGCFDAWPRSERFPSVLAKRIAVAFGRPIPHDELFAQGPDAALERIAREIESMRLSLRRHLRRETDGRFPAAGPGDQSRIR